MKLYNCPDCTHTEDTCENCTRYQFPPVEYKEINKPFIPTPSPVDNISWVNDIRWSNIHSPCQSCPNHPINGGSGNCNCILGDWLIIY